MDTVRAQAGMLAMLTSQTDEISRNTEVISHLEVIIMINLIGAILYFL